MDALIRSVAAVAFSGALIAQDRRDPAIDRPDMTPMVLCETIRGFRDIDERERPELTDIEKLQIYFEPFNYMIARPEGEDGRYRAHLVEDAVLRKAGSDRPIRRFERAVEYEPESVDPPMPLYIGTVLSIEGLRPGDYELDLTLRDELAEDRPETTRTIGFRVVERASESVP